MSSIVSHTTATAPEPIVQQRVDALAFFERAASNRTYPMLNAFRKTDKEWFPNLVHTLAKRELITGTTLRRATDDAWLSCPVHALTLAKWSELHALAHGVATD